MSSRTWKEEDFDLEDLHRQYFVYGTLRPECGNARIWEHYDGRAIWDGDAHVNGYVLRGMGIPYAERLPYWSEYKGGPRIVGALIIPSRDEDQAKGLRMALDTLEGHPNHYKRIKVHVAHGGVTLKAWMYDGSSCAHGPLIRDGDFYNNRGVQLATTPYLT